MDPPSFTRRIIKKELGLEDLEDYKEIVMHKAQEMEEAINKKGERLAIKDEENREELEDPVF